MSSSQYALCLSGRLAWFVHENVPNFPAQWMRDEFAEEYDNQHTLISPQRFGKPMSRQVCRETKNSVFFFLLFLKVRLFGPQQPCPGCGNTTCSMTGPSSSGMDQACATS